RLEVRRRRAPRPGPRIPGSARAGGPCRRRAPGHKHAHLSVGLRPAVAEERNLSGVNMDTKLMEDMTWEDVRDAAAADLPVVLSIGSTEQHGPHLPLSTDCIIPVGIALRAASEVQLIVAPPIR